MFKRIKFFLILNCVAFTIMSLVLNLIYILAGSAKTNEQFGYVTLTMQYLSVTTVMSILFFFFDKGDGKNDIYNHLTSLLIVVATVFGLGGGVYHWFPLISWYTIATLGVILVIYFVVYFLLFAKNVEASNQINKKLEEMQEAENEQDC